MLGRIDNDLNPDALHTDVIKSSERDKLLRVGRMRFFLRLSGKLSVVSWTGEGSQL